MSIPQPQKALNDFATKLEKLADDLHQGGSFSVTKLTPIKRLCADHALAIRFVSHFADIAYDQFSKRKIAEASAEQKEKIKESVEWGIKSLRAFNSDPSNPEASKLLSSVHAQLKNSQDEYKKGSWGDIRIIYSNEALIIEKALGCVLYPAEAPSLCYEIARDYAERYDPRFGSGLIPGSAGAVREIAGFFREEAKQSSE